MPVKAATILILLMLCAGCGQLRESHTWADGSFVDPAQLQKAMDVVEKVAVGESFKPQPIVGRWRKEKWLQIYTLPYQRQDVAGGHSHLAIMSRLSSSQRFEVHIFESEGEAESPKGQQIRTEILHGLEERFGSGAVGSTSG
jgi:hypothetical protein